MYEYSAKVLRVIDADTIEVSIDLGFDVWITQHVRLIGINTAEKNTDFGKLSKSYVENTLPKDTVVILQSHKNDKEKYGRYLARVLFPQSRQCLNDMLIAMGYASEYWGKGPKISPSALN